MDPGEERPRLLGLGLPCRSEGDVGATGVLAAPAPLRLAVAEEDNGGPGRAHGGNTAHIPDRFDLPTPGHAPRVETASPSVGPTGLDGALAVVLPLAAVAVRLARQHVQTVTGRPEDPRVALIVTELVTNAILHARSQARLRVVADDHAVTLEVYDDGPGRPVLTPFSDAPTTSGRGVALVDHLADRWGVTDDPTGADGEGGAGGKAVWAVVTLD